MCFLLHQIEIHQPIHSTRTYGWIATVGTPAKVLPVRLMHLLVSLRCKCLPAAIILILPSNTRTVHNTGDILLNLQLLSQHCNFIRHNFHLILQGCTLFLCRCKLLLLVSQLFPQLSGSIVQHLCCDVLGLCMGTACGICPSDIVWRCCAQCSREAQRGYRTNGGSTALLFRLSLFLSLLFHFLLFLLCTVDPRFLWYFCPWISRCSCPRAFAHKDAPFREESATSAGVWALGSATACASTCSINFKRCSETSSEIRSKASGSS